MYRLLPPGSRLLPSVRRTRRRINIISRAARYTPCNYVPMILESTYFPGVHFSHRGRARRRCIRATRVYRDIYISVVDRTVFRRIACFGSGGDASGIACCARRHASKYKRRRRGRCCSKASVLTSCVVVVDIEDAPPPRLHKLHAEDPQVELSAAASRDALAHPHSRAARTHACRAARRRRSNERARERTSQVNEPTFL